LTKAKPLGYRVQYCPSYSRRPPRLFMANLTFIVASDGNNVALAQSVGE